MKRRLPRTGRWQGTFPGDLDGDFWKSSNVDVDRKSGSISLSERMNRIEDSFSGNCLAFLRSDADCEDRFWALSEDQLLKTDSASYTQVKPSNDWDTDPLDSTPTDPLDFTVHAKDSRNDSGRDKIFVTRDTGDIAVLNDTGDNKWTGSWWVTKQSQPALNVNVLRHPIQYFPFRKISIVGDGNLIHTISRPSDTQNDTVTYARLVLPPQYEAWHVFVSEDRAWINCFHKFGGSGAVVEWDGFSQTYNAIHPIPGVVPLGGASNGGVPTVVSPRGQVLEFTGNAFGPMYRGGRPVAFPIFDEQDNSLMANADTNLEVYLHPRGMAVGEDGMIYFNLRQPYLESYRQGAGIWCLNPATGDLYNKFGFGTDSVGDTTLARPYNHQYVYRSGGITAVSSHTTGRALLAGGTLYTAVNTVGSGSLWLLDSLTELVTNGTNRGYFVTPFIYADEIREFWDTLWLRFSRAVSAATTMVVKARGVRPLFNADYKPIRSEATWTSTTTFTATLAAGDEAVAVGDEVEVIGGVNAGRIAHVTVISGAHAALQTFTVDEAMFTGSSSSYVLFDRWKKVKTFTTASKYEEEVNVGIDSSFVQFKVELRGPANDLSVRDLTLLSKPSIKIRN